MTRSRLGLKALGACALVLGMMAVWAGAAQGESTGGSWTYIKEGQLTTFEGSLAEPLFLGRQEVATVGILHSKALGGTWVLYECDAMSIFEGKLQPGGKILGKVSFLECEAFLNGVLSKNCNPVGGKITTNKLKAVMLLHKLVGGTVDKILIAEPEEAAQLAFIESTAACALGIKVPVGGKYAIQDPQPTTHTSDHLVKEFPELDRKS